MIIGSLHETGVTMVKEQKPAEAGNVGGEAGIFGPLINLVHQARKIHPAAGYLLIILAIFAVGVAIYKMMDPFAGEGGLPDLLRIILFTVLLLLFLMLLVAFFADFITPSERHHKGLQLRRGILLLIMSVGGGALAWQAGENCRMSEILMGGEACGATLTDKPVQPPVAIAPPKEEEQPTTVPPPAAEPVILGGYIENMKAKETAIPRLRVRVRFGGKFYKTKTTAENFFTAILPTKAEGKKAYVTVEAAGYQTIFGSPVNIAKQESAFDNSDYSWALYPKEARPRPPRPRPKPLFPSKYREKLKTQILSQQAILKARAPTGE
ncbi:MAG: hypothetical protein V3V15_10100 [Sphingorhabdus sp.]